MQRYCPPFELAKQTRFHACHMALVPLLLTCGEMTMKHAYRITERIKCLTSIPEEAAAIDPIVRIHVTVASGGMRGLRRREESFFVAPIDSLGARNQTPENSRRTIHAAVK